MFISVSLIALCLGYLVYINAGKEKEGLKILGHVIGITVMILALLATTCGIAKLSKSGLYGKSCGVAKSIACPLSARGNASSR
jgi:hypothetical protein